MHKVLNFYGHFTFFFSVEAAFGIAPNEPLSNRRS